MNTPIIEIVNLQKKYPIEKSLFGKAHNHIYAVNGVHLKIPKGQTVGLVGESGCGKSTIGKMLVGLEKPDGGEIYFKSQPVSKIYRENPLHYHRSVQIIFQNPYGALNPRQKIYQMFNEIYRIHFKLPLPERQQRIRQLLKNIGMGEEILERYPFEFSGGQRQRLCIARALAVNPEVVVCDEPVSALDVSVQSQILKLLKELQAASQLSYLFISHDLGVVYHMCDVVYVMYLGKIVEYGETETLFNNARHPYTRALLSAIPVPDPEHSEKRIILKGDVPNPTRLPLGCPFYDRCPESMAICKEQAPPRVEFSREHWAECWLYHHSVKNDISFFNS